jgi:hypothetical protein
MKIGKVGAHFKYLLLDHEQQSLHMLVCGSKMVLIKQVFVHIMFVLDKMHCTQSNNCSWLIKHTDWSKWFAISSFPPFIIIIFDA